MAERKPTIEHPLYRAFLFGHFMLLVATFLVFSSFLPIEDENAPKPPEPTRPDVGFDLTARYGLGLQAFYRQLGYSEQTSDFAALRDDLLKNLRQAAQTPYDQMAYAVVEAEMQGAGAAVSHLEGLVLDDWSTQARRHHEALLDLYRNPDVARDPLGNQRLEQDLGLYGRLATSFHRNDSATDPAGVYGLVRQEVVRTAMSLGGWIAALLLLFVIALPLSVYTAWRFHTQRNRWGQADLNAKLPSQRAAFLEAMSAFMWLFLFFAILSTWLPMMFQWLAFALPVTWLVLRGVDLDHIVFGVGLHKGRGPLREIGAGLVGYLAGMPVLVAGFALTLVLMNLTQRDASHPIVGLFANGGFWQKLNLILMACVMAPIFEEIIFRGIFYHYLRGTAAAAGAALITGFFFAILHPQGLAAVPMLASIGFVLAMIREWRGSLIASMTAHAFNNLIPVSLLIAIY